jgi:hypothetical protein
MRKRAGRGINRGASVTEKGRVFDERDFVETWDIEFNEDDSPPCPFGKLRLAAKSCDYAKIGRTPSGRFLLLWQKPLGQPPLRREEYFIKLADEAEAENERLREARLLHIQKISRREAFRILQWYWLPIDFQKDILASTAAPRLKIRKRK